jgi:MFS family permease
LSPYRAVLSCRGALPLFTLNMLARIPICGAGMVLTLHVVLGLGRSYTAAGLAGASVTVGVAVGAPLMGRVLDSYGLRRMVAVATVAQGVFWLVAWTLPYPALLPAAFVSGLLALPAMSVGRQAVAALVPVSRRRTALSLDSISVEITYMIGPALGVLLCTKVSTVAAMLAIGAAMVFAGVALYAVNPKIRGTEENHAAAGKPARRSWLGAGMFALLALGIGEMFTLTGAELATVASLRESGQVDWTGLVIIVACLASVLGGVVYGGMRRAVSPLLLLGILAVLTLPVGLAGHSWWLLALVWIPSNLACAPTVTAINDSVMTLAPVRARGEAMGLASSANTLGLALGSPIIGFVIDRLGPTWAFVVAGAGGIATVAVGVLLTFASRSRAPAVPVGVRHGLSLSTICAQIVETDGRPAVWLSTPAVRQRHRGEKPRGERSNSSIIGR